MERNNEIKETGIKNCIYCYFNDIININNLDFDIILLNEIAYENILICHVAYKPPCGAKLLHSIFDKVDGYIRKYDRTNV